jgi:uncharacterized protein YlxW (UPF0749 family)
MNQDAMLLVHLISGILFIAAIVFALLLKAKNADLSKEIKELGENHEHQKHVLSSSIRSGEKKIAELMDKISLLDSKLTTANLDKAGLESANKLFRMENKKLLEAASDDITINVKAMDDAKIIAENPRPKRRYKKKKPSNKG